MSAGKFNITIEKGATFKMDFVHKTGGVPTDLTTKKGRMQVRPDFDSDPIEQLTATTENGCITMDAQGRVSIRIKASQTALVQQEDTGVYNFELVDVGIPSPENDVVDRVLQGKVRFSPDASPDA